MWGRSRHQRLSLDLWHLSRWALLLFLEGKLAIRPPVSFLLGWRLRAVLLATGYEEQGALPEQKFTTAMLWERRFSEIMMSPLRRKHQDEQLNDKRSRLYRTSVKSISVCNTKQNKNDEKRRTVMKHDADGLRNRNVVKFHTFPTLLYEQCSKQPRMKKKLLCSCRYTAKTFPVQM